MARSCSSEYLTFYEVSKFFTYFPKNYNYPRSVGDFHFRHILTNTWYHHRLSFSHFTMCTTIGIFLQHSKASMARFTQQILIFWGILKCHPFLMYKNWKRESFFWKRDTRKCFQKFDSTKMSNLHDSFKNLRLPVYPFLYIYNFVRWSSLLSEDHKEAVAEKG